MLNLAPDDKVLALMRKANDAIGKDAFARLWSALDLDESNELQLLMEAGKMRLHWDGFLGLCVELSDGTWSNEGFEA